MTDWKKVFPSSWSKDWVYPGKNESSLIRFLSCNSLYSSLSLIESLTSFPLFLNSAFFSSLDNVVKSTFPSLSFYFNLSANSNWVCILSNFFHFIICEFISWFVSTSKDFFWLILLIFLIVPHLQIVINLIQQQILRIHKFHQKNLQRWHQ